MRRLVYGASLWPQARIDAAGDVLERYVYASQAHVPDLVVRRDGQRIRLVTDAVGSVRAAVDADTGAVLQRLAYDAYGRETQNTNPGLQPFGFKGAFTDPVAEGAGLVWMGVRAYTPKLARFTTPDPIGLAAGWNEHDALAGDPINLIDADGRFVVPLVIAGAGAIGGAIGVGAAPVLLAGIAVMAVANAIVWRDQIASLLSECVDFARGAGSKSGDSPSPAGPMSDDQQAVKDAVNEQTLGGRKPLSAEDAETVLDWGEETGYPGVRAKPGDVADPSNWTGNPVPHIHVPGAGRGGHVPVEPGVAPR